MKKSKKIIEETEKKPIVAATTNGLTETNKWNSFGATVKPTNPIEEQLLRLTNSPFTSMD